MDDDFDEVMLDFCYADLKVDIQIEELFSLFLLEDMSFIGLGESSFDQSDLGLAFEYSSADLWRSDILSLMEGAKIVLLIPWTSSGADWELDQIIASPQLWRKTLLLIPGGTNSIVVSGLQRQALPDADAEEFRRLCDQIRNVESLIAEKGLTFDKQRPFHCSSGGAYELVSNDGRVQCREVFSFGLSDFILDEMKQWYRRATGAIG
jgi:hypothetical protein